MATPPVAAPPAGAAPAAPAPGNFPVGRVFRKEAHFANLAAVTSGVYAFSVLLLVTMASKIGPAFMSWVAEWWGVVSGIYIFIEILPLISPRQLQERREVADVISSPLATGLIWLVIPAVYIVTVFGAGWYWPNYWAWKIWITSLFPALIDLVLLLVLLEIAKTVQRWTPQ